MSAQQLAEALWWLLSEPDRTPESRPERYQKAREALAAHEAAPQRDAQAPQDWLHLKPYGYAPGNYMSRCSDCGRTPAMDKRATRCRPCAEAAFCKAQQAPQQEPVASIDDVAANVRVCFGEGAAAFNEGVDALAAEYKRCAAPQQAQAPSSADYVIELLTAAGHVTAEQVEKARAIAAQHCPLQQAQAPTQAEVDLNEALLEVDYWKRIASHLAAPIGYKLVPIREAQQAQAPGWQLVPVEPTPEMLKCARNAPLPAVMLDSFSAREDLSTKAKWSAMLQAAPQQGGNT